MSGFTYCNLTTLQLLKHTQATNLQDRLLRPQLHNLIDSYLKRKVCLYVFDCLLGNVGTPLSLKFFFFQGHTEGTDFHASELNFQK